MYNLIAIIISLTIPGFILRKRIKKDKYVLIIYISLVIGFLTRTVGIIDFPNALNVDEASSGYEAYSILNYGIDRNGNFMPIFLESWGSGQNALYTYLVIPFIKILGLNILSTRLPMVVISCISLIVLYKILKETTNKKIEIIGIIFFAICPWHIMKSRWGLESNIFPDMILYAIYFIIKYLKSKKIKNIYFSAVLLGLCAYAYGTSYFFLPIFLGFLLIYLLYKKEIKIKHCIGIIGTVFIISLPIILFIIINTFHLDKIQLFFTIPIIEENRYEEITSLFNGNLIKNSLKNFKEAIKILATQNDTLPWNTLFPYGITYIISLPFTLLGIYLNFKENKTEKTIWNLWFITAFLLLFIVEPNINRINIIIFPIIYYTILGITKIFQKIQLFKLVLPILYISLFISFQITYYITDWNNYLTFNGNLENVIKYISTIDAEKIYFEYCFKEPYIYICFYNKINPHEFVETVKYKNNYKTFESVESFGKYYFYIPENINYSENAAYVIKATKNVEYEEDLWNRVYIDGFFILTPKK